MKKVFLVQSVSTDKFRKLVKGGVAYHDLDCYAQVTSYYVCSSKKAAINDCRKHNREETKQRYFVNEVSFY